MFPAAAAMLAQLALSTASPVLKQLISTGGFVPANRVIAVAKTAAVAVQSDCALSWDPAPEMVPHSTELGTAASQLPKIVLISAACVSQLDPPSTKSKLNPVNGIGVQPIVEWTGVSVGLPVGAIVGVAVGAGDGS